MQKRNNSIAVIVAIVLLAGCWVLPVRADADDSPQTLGALVEALREQGLVIIYSNALLSPATRLTEPLAEQQPSLQVLETQLQPLGLQLQSINNAWVVVRNPDAVAENLSAAESSGDPEFIDNVIVTGTLYQITDGDPGGSLHHLVEDDLRNTPGATTDPLRASLRVPGVASVGISAKPRIRGGLQDELLVLLEGVELLEPFHLSDFHSAYSNIDYHTVEAIDFYTGGFPARYGNRMSGVMDISNDWREPDFYHQMGISSFANFFNLHRPLPGSENSWWQFSARQGDLSDLTEYIQSQSGEPEYRDVSAQVLLELAPTVRFSAGVSYAEDDIHFRDEEETASSRVNNGLLWSGVNWRSGRLDQQFTVSLLKLRRKKLLQSNFEEDEEKGGLLDHAQVVERLAIRHDNSLLHYQLLLEFGWQWEYNRADYDHHSEINRGDLAEVLGTERITSHRIDLEVRGVAAGAYLQAEWTLLPGLVVQPSLRWDTQNYYPGSSSRQQLAPRLGARFEISGEDFLQLSVGRFYQPEAVQELQVLDGVSDFYKPQSSDQAILGYLHEGRALQASVDVYYKRYRKQKQRFENVFNPFVLLPEMEPDRVRVTPQKAVASGIDLQVKYQWNDVLTNYMRYSYLDSYDDLQGRKVRRRWSQRNTLQGGILWQGQDFSVELAATWHSGWRSTRLPDFVEESVDLATLLNNVELRDHFSLDLALRKHWRFSGSQLEWFLDISNLTDRKNIAGIDFDAEERETGGFDMIADFETLLGRVVATGIILSF